MQLLFELADQINKVPLPEFTDRYGLKLPHKDDSLTAQAYQFVGPSQAAQAAEGDVPMLDAQPRGESLGKGRVCK